MAHSGFDATPERDAADPGGAIPNEKGSTMSDTTPAPMAPINSNPSPSTDPQLACRAPVFPRLPGETPRAYGAFTTFFQLGQGRTHQAVVDKLGEPLGTIRNWASKHGWTERLQEFNSGLLQAQAQAEAERQARGGARGGGKSHWLMAQIGVDDCQRFPGLNCLLLRKGLKPNIEHFESLRQRLFHALPHSYKVSSNYLAFQNGSRIYVNHYQTESDIDSYLGLEYDVIGIEEATTLTQP